MSDKEMANQLVDIIVSSDMGYDDLKMISNAIKKKWSALQCIQAVAFNYNDRVSFYDKKRYQTVYGKVAGINLKTITVITDEKQTWKVSPSLLKKVS